MVQVQVVIQQGERLIISIETEEVIAAGNSIDRGSGTEVTAHMTIDVPIAESRIVMDPILAAKRMAATTITAAIQNQVLQSDASKS